MNRSRWIILTAAALVSSNLHLAAGVNGETNKHVPPGGAKQAAVQHVPVSQARPEEDCYCEDGTLPEIFAVVNGTKITRKEISGSVEERVHRIHHRIAELRKRQLDIQINSRLIEGEADRLKVSAASLLEREVGSRVTEPDDADAKAYYERNKNRITGDFESAKKAILESIRNERQAEEAKKLVGGMRAKAKIEVAARKSMPPRSEAERKQVLAVVDGQPVTWGDLEEAMRPDIADAQNDLYSIRKAELDMRINTILLEQEAQKRGITTQVLFEREIAAKVKSVTAEQARDFYHRNKDRIEGGPYEKLEIQIIRYLQDQEQKEAEERFAAQMRAAASTQVFLETPRPPAYSIPTDDQPSKGRADAPVTIVVFTDFECPSCAREQPMLEKLAAEYGGEVQIVVRDFPLGRHARAFKAAEAARAQGKYWEYAAILYAEQTALGVEKLKEYAGQLGLNRQAFDAALDSGMYFAKVQRDLRDGGKLGVNSTPAIFVAGRRMTERTHESLKAAIDAALVEAGRTKAEPWARERDSTPAAPQH